jgi:5'-3' exonuclease
MNPIPNVLNTPCLTPNTYIFIDGSYFCFYRYFSLMTWWKNANAEEPVLLNPIQNETFVEKFKKTFVEHIKQIPKNLKINKNVQPILIVGKDCKREDIWRNEFFPEYKAHRANGPEDGFMGGPFFKMAYEEELFIQGGAQKMLKHPRLEADDCIAITVKHLLETQPNCEIYIITSDKDYLQLARPNVQLYSLAFKKLTDQKSSTQNAECDLFCKIITGDPSDNIQSVFKKCGPKTALKYFEDREKFEAQLVKENAHEKYNLNKKLVDFNEIPTNLVEEFKVTFLQ